MRSGFVREVRDSRRCKCESVSSKQNLFDESPRGAGMLMQAAISHIARRVPGQGLVRRLKPLTYPEQGEGPEVTGGK